MNIQGTWLDEGSTAEFELMPTSHKTKRKQADAGGKLIDVDTSREENLKLKHDHLPIKDYTEVFVF